MSARSFPLTRNLRWCPLTSTLAHPRHMIARNIFLMVNSLLVAKLKLRASTKTRKNVSTKTNTTLVNIASDIRTASATLNPSAMKGDNTTSIIYSPLIANFYPFTIDAKVYLFAVVPNLTSKYWCSCFSNISQ